MTVTITTTTTWVITWEVREEELCTTADPTKVHRLKQTAFADGTLELDLVQTGPTTPSLTLRAIPQRDDYEQSSSAQQWTRKGDYAIEATYFSPDLPGFASEFISLPDNQLYARHPQVTTKTSTATFGDMVAECGTEFIIEVKVSMGGVAPAPSCMRPLPDTFNQRKKSDLVFLVHNLAGDVEAPWPIYAHSAVLDVQFADWGKLSSPRSIEDEDLASTSPATRLHGVHSSDVLAIERELLPFVGCAGESSITEPNQVVVADRQVGDAEPDAKRLKRAPHSLAIECRDQKRKVIDIVDIPFGTLLAFFAYLHTGLVSFLPVVGDFLAEEFRSQTPQGDHDWSEGRPHEWLRNHHPMPAAEQVVIFGVRPCSVYSMYRLAVKVDHVPLRLLALRYIGRSVNYRNVYYELFTPLSLSFVEVRQAVYDYFARCTAHWVITRSTGGFGRVLTAMRMGTFRSYPAMDDIMQALTDRDRSTCGRLRDVTVEEDAVQRAQ